MWFGFLGFILCVQTIYAQDKSEADRLEQEYLTKTLSIPEQFSVLLKLAQNSPDPEKSLLYSEKLITLAKSQSSDSILISGLLQKGNALTLKGDLSLALQSFFEGIELVEDRNDLERSGPGDCRGPRLLDPGRVRSRCQRPGLGGSGRGSWGRQIRCLLAGRRTTGLGLDPRESSHPNERKQAGPDR